MNKNSKSASGRSPSPGRQLSAANQRACMSASSLPHNNTTGLDLDKSDFMNESKVNVMRDKTRTLAARNDSLEAQLSTLHRIVGEKDAEIKHYEDRLQDIKTQFDDFKVKSSNIAASAKKYMKELETNKANTKLLEEQSYEILTVIKDKFDKRSSEMKSKYELEIAELKTQLEEAREKIRELDDRNVTTTVPKRPHSTSPMPLEKFDSSSQTPSASGDKKQKTRISPSARASSPSASSQDASPRSEMSGVDASTSCTSLPIRSASPSRSGKRSDAESTSFDVLRETLDKTSEQLTLKKIDLRCTERELKRTKESCDMFRERNQELRTKLAELEEQLNANKTDLILKQKQLEDVRENSKSSQEKIANLASKHEAERIQLEEKVKRLEEKVKAFRDVETGMASWKQKYEECRKDQEIASSTSRRLMTENGRLNKEIITLKDKICTKEMELKRLQRSYDALKMASAQMEKQVDMYKQKCDELISHKDDALRESMESRRRVETLETKLTRAHNDLSNEKRKHEEEINEREGDKIRLAAALNLEQLKMKQISEQLQTAREDYDECAREASSIKQEISNREAQIMDMSYQLEQMHSQLVTVKEEASRNITTLTQTKLHNERLMESLQAAEDGKMNLEETRCLLNAQIESLRDQYRMEKTRLEETTNQQNKLIKFLHTRSESHQNKKKGFFAMWTPKGKHGASGGDQPPARDLTRESALERENRRLTELLERYQEEISSYKAREKEAAAEEEATRPAMPTAFPLMSSLRLQCAADSDNDYLRDSTNKYQTRHHLRLSVKQDIREIERISQARQDEDEFTFTDSMLNELDSDEEEERQPRAYYRNQGVK